MSDTVAQKGHTCDVGQILASDPHIFCRWRANPTFQLFRMFWQDHIQFENYYNLFDVELIEINGRFQS